MVLEMVEPHGGNTQKWQAALGRPHGRAEGCRQARQLPQAATRALVVVRTSRTWKRRGKTEPVVLSVGHHPLPPAANTWPASLSVKCLI